MTENHKKLDMQFDRPLLEDVFDSPELRYVALYMFILRKELFKDLEDDELIEEFDRLFNTEELTVGDLKRNLSDELLKNLFQFHIITNIKNQDAIEQKADDFKIRLAPGIKIAHQELSIDEEEVHIFCQEPFLERIIASSIPEMTQTKIHGALERLRAMMCPRTTVIHELIHKYGEYYVLDDDFYYIIESLGNPFQALRIELLIRAMSEKYKDIESKIDEIMVQFDPELPKSTYMNKFKTAKEKNKSDYLGFLVEKSRKLPIKFKVKFPENEIPEPYKKWKESVNELVGLKLTFNEIDNKMDELRAYYSGKKQVMPYMKFIEKTTYDEDGISDKVKKLLVEARNSLKNIAEGIEKYPKKEMKILNLDIERMIVEQGLDEEEEDD